MREKVNVIYSESDYGRFKFLDGNRDAKSVQKILDSMENKKVFNRILLWLKVWWQDTRRQLLWNSPWKDAQGDDLPEIDREVIALLDNGKVVFAHRPPKYWDGKDIDTNKVTRYYPKTCDKGDWNIPDVKWWLDCSLPNMED